ncbi:putative signal transduction protein with CBS domains [Nostocoides japonicum T1-X7]|uniref:Putative signal transduction protein with CBS domains n=1 Tax=Nostocoides japonicum T1-X7 TaxID=1194083 RepID=A0A077M3G1_9MICO|nr:putative nucleotidyltransferase substrate binding domain-containing protein [Tetrasphaera japonica]CCH79597.1 putative signal transduction protein with CBS domains [Tetrasphaera japonica T1-X7]
MTGSGHRIEDAGQREEALTTGLAEFLAGCPPLDALSEEELRRAARTATVERYRAGEVILDAFDASSGQLFVVREGRVNIWAHADRLSELPDETAGPRSLFGYTAALMGEAVGPLAAALGEAVVVRLDADLVARAFSTRRGAEFLTRRVSASTRQRAGIPLYTVVADLIVNPPTILEATDSLRAAAQRMSEMGLGYCAVRLSPASYGLVTDATMRDAVAAGVAIDRPLADVADRHPSTVRPDTSAAEALIRLLESDADLVLVTDAAGTLRGALGPRDFVVSSTTAGASLHEQIRRADSVADLQSRYRRVPAMLSDLLSRGLEPSRVITVHSAIVDTVIRRALDLVQRRFDDLDPDVFTWLSLGSNGRREAVLSSDIDAAASFTDGMSQADIARYLPLFSEVAAVLQAAGLRHDSHGTGPTNPTFARTHAEWAAAGREWLTHPTQDDAIIMTCMLVDARPIHGDLGLTEVATVFSGLRRHPDTMRLLLRTAAPRRGVMRRSALPRRRDRELDLKKQVLLPIVNIARWAALTVGDPALPTRERLGAAAGSEMLSTEDAATLRDLFEILQGIRLRHQVRQLDAHEPPTDTVQLAALSTPDRTLVLEGARDIAAIQRRMANMASFVLPELSPGPAPAAARQAADGPRRAARGSRPAARGSPRAAGGSRESATGTGRSPDRAP